MHGIFGLAALALASAAFAAAPSYKVTTKRDDDRVEVKGEKGVAVFEVTSPFGIGEATIERAGDAWPGEVVVRLRLRGMESFNAEAGKGSLAAKGGRLGEKPVVLEAGGTKESPSDPKSPYWTEFRMVGGDGKPATKENAEGGYFELWLPKPLFEGNPKSLKLSWVDFYRN